MEALWVIMKIIGILVFCVIVMQTAEMGYQWVFPKKPATMLIVVEHRIVADNLTSSVDITNEVLFVAKGVDETIKRANQK